MAINPAAHIVPKYNLIFETFIFVCILVTIYISIPPLNRLYLKAIQKLVLNLGHSPLYRHFYKCLYIELLKISLVY